MGRAGQPADGRPGAAAPASGYVLRCSHCDTAYEDDGYQLECPRDHGPALLVTDYARRRFEPDPDHAGVFRYVGWLPARRVFPVVGGTVTFCSEALNRAVGLPHLWVAFNGYWPERGARLETGTFKELEAWTVLSRLPRRDDTTLVIASAGNTGAAFARIASQGGVPCLVIVPRGAMSGLQFAEAVAPNVRIVSLGGAADYYDAIKLAGRVSELDGFVAEGGVRNVGRRDGLATALLNAVETIGRLPDCYFQAVGSGAGAIAAHEAAGRLLADGRFGSRAPRLMLSQNAPLTPIHDSWRQGRRELVKTDDVQAKRLGRELLAQVLSNPRPPYSTFGGVYDALSASDGDVFVVANAELERSRRWFEELMGIDLDPASAVAVASLRAAVAERRVDPDGTIVLNVTGGGRRRFVETTNVVPARAALELGDDELLHDDTPARIAALFGR